VHSFVKEAKAILVNKAYKFRIYPNKEQAITIAKTIGCSRFVFNHKRCSTTGCDHKVDAMPLSIRHWTCEKCHTNHDRDINASKNILAEGLRQLTFA
jgi:putative transposase